MQTLQTTSHCHEHAIRLELTSCESYMERHIQMIRKEKRDAMKTLQTACTYICLVYMVYSTNIYIYICIYIYVYPVKTIESMLAL